MSWDLTPEQQLHIDKKVDSALVKYLGRLEENSKKPKKPRKKRTYTPQQREVLLRNLEKGRKIRAENHKRRKEEEAKAKVKKQPETITSQPPPEKVEEKVEEVEEIEPHLDLTITPLLSKEDTPQEEETPSPPPLEKHIEEDNKPIRIQQRDNWWF